LPSFSSIRRSSRSLSASNPLRSSGLPGSANVKSSRLQGLEPSVESTSYSRCFHPLARVASLGFPFCKGPDSHWPFTFPSSHPRGGVSGPAAGSSVVFWSSLHSMQAPGLGLFRQVALAACARS
jgi:hypothetical protein